MHKTREMHEREAIRIICQDQLRNLPIWESLFAQIEFNKKCVEMLFYVNHSSSENRLSLKIWMQLMAYSMTSLKENMTDRETGITSIN